MDFESEAFVTHPLRADGFDASEDGTGRGTPIVAASIIKRDAKGADSDTKPGHLVFGWNKSAMPVDDKTAGTLQSSATSNPAVMLPSTAVRRLTPRECERLQGFPDDWTLVPHNGKPAKDGPRYAALGNAMPVPVVRWIGKRIAAVDGRMKRL